MPKFVREVEIDAPVEKVWQVITNPDQWPQWFPGFDSVSNVTSVSEGGKFDWASEGRSGRGSIVNMDENKRLEIMTQVGDDKDSHVFELRPSGGFLGLNADECTVKYILDTLTGGGILVNFVTGGNPVDALKVKKAMNLLRKTVETI